MKIQTWQNNNINKESWRKLLENSAVASFFQSPECFEFYKSLSFLNPFLFGVSENNRLVGIACGYIIKDGGVIKSFFSRRAIIPGGLLLDDNISDEALSELLKIIKKSISKKAIYIEIRNYTDYSDFKNVFEKWKFKYNPHLNFHISTPDIDTALKNLSSTKRRDVKLSLREGAVISTAGHKDEILEFYNLLEDLYKTKIKIPLFPLEFFEKIVFQSAGKIFLVKFKEKIIGGSVCVGLENKVLYEWFVCGTDGRHKNIFPSTLATWAAVEYAAKNGYLYFDMMGAGKPEESYGVREFKSKFGGSLVEHGRYRSVNNRFLYFLGRKAVSFMKNKK